MGQSGRICSVESCVKRHQARGLCSTHYHKARVRGEIDLQSPKLPTAVPHRLTNIDRENSVADCSECGEGVKIRVREGRSCECNIGRRQYDRTKVARRLREKYKLTLSERQSMYTAQGGQCLICRKAFARLVIDHCHTTGRVRGLLCRQCNLAIGLLHDNSATALAAAEYLQTHQRG